ncbi:SDR family oxidoreductase [Buttiauxella sp. 3AFRM03]|uniref:NAD-dependent epimerase/dehydratase family protein n=1 Tax=Buttiauxella sp. 3AFRM03 TaxID=2479367 RepID=UPI000EF78463|nr:NAD-dependent epimerase/dehydratase family protein [Buttiauxella sp. 3AFRM03]AYN29773.1 SDR family oxidoreductase [Buttiauxella sp. 3AFRM03]
MKILLTGTTGYIGQKTAEFLANSGHDIHSVVRKLPENVHLLNENKIKYYLLSQSSIKDIVFDVKPEIVVHIASKFLAVHNYDDIDDLISSNIIFPTQLLEAMCLAGVKNFINTGTSWQHYNSESYNPVNLYAATKQAFEDIIKYYTDTNKIKSITLKIYDSYGPQDNRGKLISLLDRLATSQEKLEMSPGQQKISLVHVNDICRAFHIAVDDIIERDLGYNIQYGLMNDEKISLMELVSVYESANNCNLNIIWGGREYREREVMYPAENLNTLPGWSPQISLLDGLKISNRS